MTLKTSEIAHIIGSFVDHHYPKGNKNRGFALTVLAVFLLEQNKKNSKYKIIKNVDKRKRGSR